MKKTKSISKGLERGSCARDSRTLRKPNRRGSRSWRWGGVSGL